MENINYYYDNVYDFSDGLAVVKKNGKYGYIDKTGKLLNLTAARDVQKIIIYNTLAFVKSQLQNIKKMGVDCSKVIKELDKLQETSIETNIVKKTIK